MKEDNSSLAYLIAKEWRKKKRAEMKSLLVEAEAKGVLDLVTRILITANKTVFSNGKE
jgi:hypothetical protein